MTVNPSDALRAIAIEPCTLDAACESLRQEVRDFLATELADLPPLERAKNWSAADPAFSRKLGARGWIGMTWPRAYGGAERTSLERYVVLEELLAAGAPVAAHWIADRQSGPLLIRFAPQLAARIAPSVAAGETFFCIGMSEPDSGSDLASVRTRAEPVDGGYIVRGTKLWTTFAHLAHYMIALGRTSGTPADRHKGLSQLLIDMRAPGVRVSPIHNMTGDHDFNTVVLDDVFVPHDHVIGQPGDGWKQVTSELAFERSGPERYLSNTQLLREIVGIADADDSAQAEGIGRLVADYAVLRQMSLGVASMLMRGEDAGLAAALVKDQGALLEQRLPEVAHVLFADAALPPQSSFAQVQRHAQQASMGYSLRGGTREILRGIIARGLGLR